MFEISNEPGFHKSNEPRFHKSNEPGFHKISVRNKSGFELKYKFQMSQDSISQISQTCFDYLLGLFRDCSYNSRSLIRGGSHHY